MLIFVGVPAARSRSFLALAVAACILQGCQAQSVAQGEAPPLEAQPLPASQDLVTRVEAVRVRRGPLALSVEATGHLKASRKVVIQAEEPGRVIEVKVSEGDWIERGSLLLRLDDRAKQIEIEEARAELLSAQASFALLYREQGAEREPAAHIAQELDERSDSLARVQELFDQGLISRQELEDTRLEAKMDGLLSGRRKGEIQAVRSGVLQAEQRLARAELALEKTRITAPFAGTISNLRVDEGQHLTAGEPSLDLLDDSRLSVEVRVLQGAMVRLQKGAPARVRIPAVNNRVFEGFVASIDPQIDPERGTGKLTVSLSNPERELMPGLFAFLELQTQTLADRLTVPLGALLERDRRELVFRIRDGEAEWVYVTVGAQSKNRVEIVAGLAEGDVVAIDGHFSLAHQARVEAIVVDDP